MAFIALDEDTGHMLGLVRLKDELDEKTAEFAILVRSRVKGHGLGWLLMRRIINYAKEKGLRRVYGDVLVENTNMLQCAPNSASTRRTWDRKSGALCSISTISAASSERQPFGDVRTPYSRPYMPLRCDLRSFMSACGR